MRHIPQELIDEATEALQFGRTLEDVAGRLGLRDDYLAMLIRSTGSKSRADSITGVRWNASDA